MTEDRRDRRDVEAGTPMDTRAGAEEADAFWSRSFADRDYTRPDKAYDYYRPAYRLGHAWARTRGGSFEDAEAELRDEWRAQASALGWEEARPAVRDAFEREANTSEADPGNPLV